MRKLVTPLFLTAIVLFARPNASAQISIGAANPDPHAMLDIVSTQKGLLLPRLSAAQQATLAATLGSGQTGMLIRDSATGKVLCWTSSAWQDASGLPITAATPLSISRVDTIAFNPGTHSGDLITWDGNNWVNMQPAIQHFSVLADNRQPLLTLNFCIALQGIFPSRNSSTPFLSEIEIYSFSFPPKGFALCNGQLLPINQNQAIFSLLGTTYGGNGTTNFALPNLQGRVPVHMGNGFVIGQTGGSETSTLTQ